MTGESFNELIPLLMARNECLRRMEAATTEAARVLESGGWAGAGDLGPLAAALEKARIARGRQMKALDRFVERIGAFRQAFDAIDGDARSRIAELERTAAAHLKRIEDLDHTIRTGIARLVSGLHQSMSAERIAVDKVRKFKSRWVEATGEGLDTKL